MLYLIFKNYLVILLSIGLASILLLAFGFYLIFRSPGKSHSKSFSQLNKHVLTDIDDIKPFAGEDPIATQLDLARAYLETGNAQLAKKMLLSILEKGNTSQHSEAKILLSRL